MNQLMIMNKIFMFRFRVNIFFERVWLSACKKLHLEWIPLFSGGIDVKKDDLQLVLVEL